MPIKKNANISNIANTNLYMNILLLTQIIFCIVSSHKPYNIASTLQPYKNTKKKIIYNMYNTACVLFLHKKKHIKGKAFYTMFKVGKRSQKKMFYS